MGIHFTQVTTICCGKAFFDVQPELPFRAQPESSGYPSALKTSTGALVWKYTTNGGIIFSSPAVANGVVYIGSEDGNLYALNASTGVPLWQYTTGNAIYSSPAVANGVVYVGSHDGNLYAFDRAGGQMSKSSRPPQRPDPSLLRPNWELQPSTPITKMPSDLEKQLD